MKDIKIFISTILILISFFLSYFFNENKNNYKNNINKTNYVNLEILKTKIKITKDENTIITVNWKIEENLEINLK